MTDESTDKASEATATRSWLDVLERWARVFSLVALPVVLAVVGFVVEAALKDKSLDRDYVTIALEILAQPPEQQTDSLLRVWAVDLLQESSPVKLPDGLGEAVVAGAVSIPVPTAAGVDRSGAREAERLGFARVRTRDVDSAIEAFTRAEELWPQYHWVYEIGRLLTRNRDALTGPGAPMWREVDSLLIFKFTYGMPSEHATAEAQRLLKQLGLYDGPIDAERDSLTESAIREFQESTGLTPDGIPGPKTLRALWGAAHEPGAAGTPVR